MTAIYSSKFFRIAVVVGALMLAALLVALLATENPVQAAFPGENGRIAYGGTGGIYTINPVDSRVKRVFEAPAYSPTWSPNGRKIAFIQNTHIYKMNADGSHQVQLTRGKRKNHALDWSPDGKRIVISKFVNATNIPSQTDDLFTMSSDGSNVARLTSTQKYHELEPAWSPDGSKIAYVSSPDNPLTGPPVSIDVINADGPEGSKQVLLTRDDISQFASDLDFPDWSPDGGRIIFTTGGNNPDLYYINADGSGLDFVTQGSEAVFSPDGSKIAFFTYTKEGDQIVGQQLWTSDTDGSNRKLLKTFNNRFPYGLSWQPLP